MWPREVEVILEFKSNYQVVTTENLIDRINDIYRFSIKVAATKNEKFLITTKNIYSRPIQTLVLTSELVPFLEPSIKNQIEEVKSIVEERKKQMKKVFLFLTFLFFLFSYFSYFLIFLIFLIFFFLFFFLFLMND